MINYIPYTYLIGWSKLDKWYYGCEYASSSKIANPHNLWNTYFTSSKLVAMMREFYGEPDIIQIRKTFKNQTCTKIWEEKVLRKMKVLNDKRWLNENISGCKFGISSRFSGKKHSKESLEKNRQSQLGRKHSEETKRKIALGNSGKILSKEHKIKLSIAKTGKKMSKEFCQRRSELVSGINNPKFDPSLFTFIHPIYGEITTTKYEMKTKYGATNIHNVIKGHPKYSHSNGWKLKHYME